MADDMDISDLRSWVGRTRTVDDVITRRAAESLVAVLDETGEFAEGGLAPAGIQWCLSPDIAPMSGLGLDGHPARGGFLPPVRLPRRMWAGGRLRFHGDFRIGERIRRVSEIRNVELKEGRSGTLCFVTVAHDYHGDDGLLLSEEQDIVYRGITPTAPLVAPSASERVHGDCGMEIEATPVLLARYSAVTFNGHRVHYDRDYARDTELYPGLLVHGPLQATYLLRLARDTFGHMPARFDFRGRAPLFDGQSFSLNAGREKDGRLPLWVEAQNGAITFDASAGRTPS